MRWLPFFILVYLALGIQQGASGYVEIGRTRLNLALIVVVFIAANAPRDVGLLACIVVGVTQDLLNSAPWGISAFTYGVVAIAVMSIKDVVYGDHMLTHFVLVLYAGFIETVVRAIHGWIYTSIHAESHWPRPTVGSMLGSAIYTAVIGVPILYLLGRLRRSFGMRAPRRAL